MVSWRDRSACITIASPKGTRSFRFKRKTHEVCPLLQQGNMLSLVVSILFQCFPKLSFPHCRTARVIFHFISVEPWESKYQCCFTNSYLGVIIFYLVRDRVPAYYNFHFFVPYVWILYPSSINRQTHWPLSY